MSCNGCRILRKGCSETCILRPSLQSIDTAEAQAHATLFVAKFFGRAGLLSFIAAVPQIQRPALFESLLFEAAGRTVNPVSGAVGLLSTGNWHVCQAAVETVLRGGALKPLPEYLGTGDDDDDDVALDCADIFKLESSNSAAASTRKKFAARRRRSTDAPAGLDLSLTAGFPDKESQTSPEKSEDSIMTTWGDQAPAPEVKLLKLFH